MKLLSGESALMPHSWLVNMNLDGLVSSSNKPLPEPMLTQIYSAIWRH